MKPPRPSLLFLPCLAGLLLTARAAGASSPPLLPLDAAIALALRDNPTLEIARRERNVALIGAERARPAFRPEITATATQIVRAPRLDLPGRTDEVVLPNAISRLEVGFRQPVYQFGAGAAPAKRANAMVSAARSDYRTTELDTVQQVREAYLNTLRAEALGEVARQGLELARENVRTTHLLEERGFQARVDVLEAERALSEAESQALQAQGGAALARANLNRLLGRAIDTPLQTVEPGPLPPEPGLLPELTAEAMRQRPEAETLRHRIAEAEAGIRLAKAARQPRVTLDVAYALQTETALVPRSGIAAGVSLTAPLFEGAASRLTVREAEERLAQLKSALAALEQGVALEIEQQRLAMSEARARMAAARRAAEAAEKTHEITLARLERGRAVQLEILNARLNLQRARAGAAEAENDLRLARARLLRALGSGPAS